MRGCAFFSLFLEWRADAEGGFFDFATAAEVERGAAGFLAACAVDAAWPAGRAAGCLAADLAGTALAVLRAGDFGAAVAFFATFFTAFFGAAARFGAFAGTAAFFPDAVGRAAFFAAALPAVVFTVTVFFAATFFATTFPAADFFATVFFTGFFTAFFFGATFAADARAGAALRAAALAGACTAFFAVFAGLAVLAAVAAFFTLEPLPAAVLPLGVLACWVVRVDFAISISRCDLAAGCYSL